LVWLLRSSSSRRGLLRTAPSSLPRGDSQARFLRDLGPLPAAVSRAATGINPLGRQSVAATLEGGGRESAIGSPIESSARPASIRTTHPHFREAGGDASCFREWSGARHGRAWLAGSRRGRQSGRVFSIARTLAAFGGGGYPPVCVCQLLPPSPVQLLRRALLRSVSAGPGAWHGARADLQSLTLSYNKQGLSLARSI
jgi:hypothetical protein